MPKDKLRVRQEELKNELPSIQKSSKFEEKHLVFEQEELPIITKVVMPDQSINQEIVKQIGYEETSECNMVSEYVNSIHKTPFLFFTTGSSNSATKDRIFKQKFLDEREQSNPFEFEEGDFSNRARQCRANFEIPLDKNKGQIISTVDQDYNHGSKNIQITGFPKAQKKLQLPAGI